MNNWFKVAAIGVGIIIAFLVVGSVVHFILGAITTILILAAVAVGIGVAIKVARSRKQVSGKRQREDKQVREPDYSEYARPLPRADVEPVSPPPGRPSAQDIDDELARLKREMGS